MEIKETTRKLCNNLHSWHLLRDDLLMVKEQGEGRQGITSSVSDLLPVRLQRGAPGTR